MMPFRGQASWAKMTSPGGKLSALVCHQPKVNKAEELTYLSIKIDNLMHLAPGANVLILFAAVIFEWVK
jgi:hypothetical protein